MTSSKKNSANIRERHFYGRRIGRPLSGTREGALKTLLPALDIPENLITGNGDLDPLSLFNPPSLREGVVLEIGFGNGEHLAEMTRLHPENAYIGVEPFKNGMSAFLSSIDGRENKNIRVYMEDAIPLALSLTDRSIDSIYVLNPDPWHKKRHYKRRIINPETLDIFARILKPGGLLIMTTDVPELAEWMAAHAALHPAFTWTANSKADWETPPKNWFSTRYETKGAKGAVKMCYLIFQRKA